VSEPVPGRGLTGVGRQPAALRRPEGANLADILERVLDKGIVIAGDIQVNLLDIELLTIKLRLVICSVDRAKEMGIDWWEHDPTLSSRHTEMAEENRRLRDRLAALEGGPEEEDEDEAAVERREPRAVGRPERREPPERDRLERDRLDRDRLDRDRLDRDRLDRDRRERRPRTRPREEDDYG
jgi:hypothetical protein